MTFEQKWQELSDDLDKLYRALPWPARAVWQVLLFEGRLKMWRRRMAQGYTEVTHRNTEHFCPDEQCEEGIKLITRKGLLCGHCLQLRDEVVSFSGMHCNEYGEDRLCLACVRAIASVGDE